MSPRREVPDDYDPRPYIAAQTWVYARTVPDNPHEYLLAERTTDPDGHALMIAWVAQTGAPGTYANTRYRYAQVDDWVYWVSRPPRWGTELRAHPEPAPSGPARPDHGLSPQRPDPAPLRRAGFFRPGSGYWKGEPELTGPKLREDRVGVSVRGLVEAPSARHTR